ncbi:hypothetical protein [Photorhabdus sp. SF281]|uniref:hypothetical protein n=1 Tax=Photorhabdus sp. SF281 TaxID=3459527 RepID=UPI004044986F
MPPRVAQADHDDVVCQMCQSALSPPRAKTPSWPSALTYTAGLLVIPPPSDCQPDQEESVFGTVYIILGII